MPIGDTIRRWARMARAAPLPDGMAVNGSGPEAIGADSHVLLVFDSNGRVFQLHGAQVHNAGFRQIPAGRSEVMKLLDHFDIQDVDWTDIPAND